MRLKWPEPERATGMGAHPPLPFSMAVRAVEPRRGG